MVEKIKGLSIQGRCFLKHTNLDLFPEQKDRVSIVFGRNGSGKSTISKGIDGMIHTDDSVELSSSFYDYDGNPVVLNPASDGLFVFNEDYIRRNLRIGGDGLQTIILLGNQVDVADEMNRCLERKRHAEIELEKTETALADVSGNSSPEARYDAVKDILKNGGWAARDCDIRGNKVKTRVNDSIVTTICEKTNVSDGETAETLERQFDEKMTLLNRISSGVDHYPTPIPQIQWSMGAEGEILKGLSHTVEQPVWTEREKQIFAVVENKKYTLSFVHMAQATFGREKTTVCPYCYQNVTQEYKKALLQDMNRVLNPAAEKHEKELQEWDAFLRNLLQELRLETVRQCSDVDQTLCKNILNLASQIVNQIIPVYRDALAMKLENVYQPVETAPPEMEARLGELNSLLAQMEAMRTAYNQAARQAGRLRQELTRINDKIGHLQASSAYAAYLKQAEKKREMEGTINRWHQEIENCERERKRLNQRRSTAGYAATLINRELEYVFFSKDRLNMQLGRDSGGTEHYILKSNNEDVKPGSVSAGERNIIALCYFFAEMLSNTEADDFDYEKESLIVIDDPISSFDFENRVGMMTLLRYQASRIISNNEHSRILIFSHDLATVYDLETVMRDIGCSRCIYELMGKERKLSNFYSDERDGIGSRSAYGEYGILLRMILFYARDEKKGDNPLIGNAMRRVLEAFSTFMYRKGIIEVSRIPEIKKELGDYGTYFENMMYRLVLHGESHFESQITASYDDIKLFGSNSEEEKRSIAKSVLIFIYLLNPLHIKSYLKKNEWRLIEQWKNQLGTEGVKRVFDAEGVPQYTIPLYELPLSAGLGNVMFDDSLPHENYTTTNPKCNFALRVSGDSMEPKIPDGSIVLIRKTDDLSNGKIGAFFLDGEVFCKKIFHNSNGSVSLVSFKSGYKPIPVSNPELLTIYGEVVQWIPPGDKKWIPPNNVEYN